MAKKKEKIKAASVGSLDTHQAISQFFVQLSRAPDLDEVLRKAGIPRCRLEVLLDEEYVRIKNRRVEYIFTGLRHNLDSIKSKARILLCWVDEAETVSEIAWQKLLPTIREENSEVWVTWNPEKRAGI